MFSNSVQRQKCLDLAPSSRLCVWSTVVRQLKSRETPQKIALTRDAAVSTISHLSAFGRSLTRVGGCLFLGLLPKKTDCPSRFMKPEPIERQTFDTSRLMGEYSPAFFSENKRVVYDIACAPHLHHGGKLNYSRWRAMSLPRVVSPVKAALRVSVREDIYDYAACTDLADAVEWHVNFADPELFVAYSSGLFAQDEMQVAEHPALGALKDALESGGRIVRTVETQGATPILIKGVERRCRVQTSADPAAGRPQGLYGNAFAQADPIAVRGATQVIDPPTITNLIAIAAPRPGRGQYTQHQIYEGLGTAFTGFRAAVCESEPSRAVVHTGFWGCGAFGGNRTLMPFIQAVAAEMAGVERLVFHTFDAAGTRSLNDAMSLAMGFGDRSLETWALVENLEERRFEWGVSDGN
jgi:hypothetical protein